MERDDNRYGRRYNEEKSWINEERGARIRYTNQIQRLEETIHYEDDCDDWNGDLQ